MSILSTSGTAAEPCWHQEQFLISHLCFSPRIGIFLLAPLSPWSLEVPWAHSPQYELSFFCLTPKCTKEGFRVSGRCLCATSLACQLAKVTKDGTGLAYTRDPHLDHLLRATQNWQLLLAHTLEQQQDRTSKSGGYW